MPEGDRAAIHIEFFTVQIERFLNRNDLSPKRLVYLPEIYILFF